MSRPDQRNVAFPSGDAVQPVGNGRAGSGRRENAPISRRVTEKDRSPFTGGDDPDPGQQIDRRSVLEQKPAGARPQRAVHVLVEVERGSRAAPRLTPPVPRTAGMR
jgi:hypothetical protein